MTLTPKSLRGRAVAGAVLAMFAFTVALGAVMLLLVARTERASLVEILQTRADDVQALVAGPDFAVEADSILNVVEPETPVLVQVVAANSAVIASTPGLPPTVDLCGSGSPGAEPETVDLDLGTGPTQVLRVVRDVPDGGVAERVCAVASTEPIRTLQRTILVVLLAVLPIVLLGVGVAVWAAVREALRSVDGLRRQAETMTTSGSLEVAATGDEIEQLGRTLNDLLDRLHAQQRATRQFVADAGHELRNPLATLRVALEFEAETQGEARSTEMALALLELRRLERLVSDLLVLARVDAHEQPSFEDLDIEDLVAASIDAHRRTWSDIRFVDDLEPGSIRGDARSLRSAVDNLLANAARHAVSTVTISGRRVDGGYDVRVDDDGAGIPADQCQQVFERFVRLDESRDRDAGGSGLGLAIVASIAAAHGGSATAAPGPGGHFVLRVPAVPPVG